MRLTDIRRDAMQATALIRPGEIDQWDQALYAFLAEKERRSGSRRTVESYSRMLQHFFGLVAKTPERVTSPEVFGWAHGIGLSGREPSSITIGARLACLSSFCRFLIHMGLMQNNPCEAIERPKAVASPPRGMSADAIKQLLAVIPDTPTGLRDRAIILTLTFTGRRRAEVMNLKARDIVRDGSQVFYTYRGKGGKAGKRELPMPAYEAIVSALAALVKELPTMRPDESLWPSAGSARGVTSGTFYGNLRRYLGKAGLPFADVLSSATRSPSSAATWASPSRT